MLNSNILHGCECVWEKVIRMSKIPLFGLILMLVILLGSGPFLPSVLCTRAGAIAPALAASPLAAVSIGEAVDNTALTWKSGGNVAWSGQTTTSYYGGDAAQSGDISDSQTSWVSTQIQGLGKYLRFYWKVSSEQNYDFLSLYMDGVLMDRISGEVNWQEKTYYIPTSWHTFEWDYVKDGSVSSGSDAGWVDYVQVISPPGPADFGDAVENTALTWHSSAANSWFGESAIYINGGDAAQSGYIGNSVSTYIETSVTGPGNLYFYWKVSSESADYLGFYVDGVSQGGISGQVDWAQESFSIASGLHILKWQYNKDASLVEGADAGWLDKVEFTPTSISIGEAVDNTALTWSSGGDAHWFGQTATSYYGGDAAQSGPIIEDIEDQSTWVRTTVTGPGTLSFYWKVSSEANYDFLEFYIDNALQSSISGEVNWQQKSYSVASGSHVLQWMYGKDRDTSVGSDKAWLDRVQFTASIPTGEAVDNTGLTWTTGGDAGWFGQTATSFYGGDAAQSGPIIDEQTSWVRTTVTGPGTLSFYWKVSSEANYDILEFDIDGLFQSGLSGEVDWQQKSYSVASGSHVLQWMYGKDRDSSAGSDKAWLDRVQFTSTPTSTITVTAPNGGQNWVRGTVHTITWNYTGSPGANVKIELLKGGILNTVISSSTANDGSYSWNISSTQTVGTNYRVRVTSTSNSAITDTSNSDFTISVGALTVTAPNGGQSWVRGTVHTITWTSTGSPGVNVKIELLKSGVLNTVISSSTANDGSYSWTILSTQTLGTDYKVRITSTSNAAITDSSNSNFAITAGALTVTAPNGGQTWARGSVHSITWTSTGSPGVNVKIELLKGGVMNRVISSSTANDGSYSWTILSTQTVGSDYKIRITSTSITSITDSSNSNFAIS